MSITRYPAMIVIEDECGELAIITMDDGTCARVEIKSVTNAAGWPELSAEIHAALQDMRLDGDEYAPA